MFKRGDEVVTVPGLWHNGQDVGERLATVLSTYGHILIHIHQYDDNPVKVFRWEIQAMAQGEDLRLFEDEEIDDIFKDFFPQQIDLDLDDP